MWNRYLDGYAIAPIVRVVVLVAEVVAVIFDADFYVIG
jgi:hypothetical protein